MKKNLKKILIAGTIVAAFFYVLSSLSSLLNTGHHWLFGILPIGFPYLLLALLLLTLLWLFTHKKIAFFLIILMLAGYKNITTLYGFNKQAFNYAKAPNSLRIMQWNCNGIGGTEIYKTKNVMARNDMFLEIKKLNPDVIIMQELTEYTHELLRSNVSLIKDSLGFAYLYFDSIYNYIPEWGGNVNMGNIICSKLPLENKGNLFYKVKKYNETISWADINFNNKKARLVNTHFQSMYLNIVDSNVSGLSYFQKEDSIHIYNTKSRLNKLIYYQKFITKQAKQLKQFLDTCSIPVILGADLNSVPASFEYQLISNNYQDAFLKKGTGLGKTHHSFLPNLRIDYLLLDKRFKIIQYKLQPLAISDHHAQIIDVEY